MIYNIGRRKLTKDAAGVIKLFLILATMRKYQEDKQRRASLLLKLIPRVSRFRIQRHTVRKSEGGSTHGKEV